jgi:hypothetical protein
MWKWYKMVHKVRRQDGRSVILMETRGQRQRDEMESMPGLTLTDPWETTTAPASNAGNADAAARPVRSSSRPRTAPSCASSSSRRGPSVPGKRVCAASRRQNRDGTRPAGRGAMHLYGAADDFEAVGRQHLEVLQFFQMRVAKLALDWRRQSPAPTTRERERRSQLHRSVPTRRMPRPLDGATNTQDPVSLHNPAPWNAQECGRGKAEKEALGHLERAAWEQQCLQGIGILHQHRTRSIECHGAQIVRHGMPGRPNLKHETFAATSMERRQHPDHSFDHSAVE